MEAAGGRRPHQDTQEEAMTRSAYSRRLAERVRRLRRRHNQATYYIRQNRLDGLRFKQA
jgi:hypothetical protein